MRKNILNTILSGKYPDDATGQMLTVPTKSIVISNSLAGAEQEVVTKLGLGKHLAIVSDATTHEVLGKRVEQALESCAEITSVILPDRPHANIENVHEIRRLGKMSDGYIAVGTGTINDLCKYASFLDSKPYAVFGTAPSMNGYTSVNASIEVDHLKHTFPAHCAVGAFFDLTILANAPVRLIHAGLGDSLCRSTAQADWLLSHLLFNTPYQDLPFSLLAEDEQLLLAEPESLLQRDLAAMERLIRTLILSGIGMTLCGGSYPASQGEHLIAHYIELMAPSNWSNSFHGEQIGVTTLTMAHLQEHVLSGDVLSLKPSNKSRDDFIRHFGEVHGPTCWEEFSKKKLDKNSATELNALLSEKWTKVQTRISSIMRPASFLQKVLIQVKAPRKPEDLNWSTDIYSEAVLHAREIRNRYTFLDLAVDSGILQTP